MLKADVSWKDLVLDPGHNKVELWLEADQLQRFGIARHLSRLLLRMVLFNSLLL